VYCSTSTHNAIHKSVFENESRGRNRASSLFSPHSSDTGVCIDTLAMHPEVVFT